MLISNWLAVDLGTENTHFYLKGKGIFAQSESYIAFNKFSSEIIACGKQAKDKCRSNSPYYVCDRIFSKDRVLSFELAEKFLSHFLSKFSVLNRIPIFTNYFLVSAPCNISEVELTVLRELFSLYGRYIYFCPKSLAAILGCSIDYKENKSYLIVDLGAGFIELSLFYLGGLIFKKDMSFSLDCLKEELLNFLVKDFNIKASSYVIEIILQNISDIFDIDEERFLEIKGKSILNGLPVKVIVNEREIKRVFIDFFEKIFKEMKSLIKSLPADLLPEAIYFTGGGASIPGLIKESTRIFSINSFCAEEPIMATIRGLGNILENFKDFKDTLLLNFANYEDF